MCDLFLFRKSYSDYKAAVCLFKGIEHSDEMTINNVGYFLQQSVEKALKAFLEAKGVTAPKSHNITTLVKMSKDNGSACKITSWIETNTYMLTEWENGTRYIVDYSADLSKLHDGLLNVKTFLATNGICSTALKEVTDEVKTILKNRIPLNDQPRDTFEWNILYMLYRCKFELESKETEYVDFDLGKYCELMGITDIPKEIERLKLVYNTNDINTVKRRLKEVIGKLS